MVATERAATGADAPLLLTMKEGGARYGFPLSTLYELAAKGVPGFVRTGRAVKVHRVIFEEWLHRQAGGNEAA